MDPTALLVVRCQLGERDALAELVRTWHTQLWNYARRMAGDAETADELTQETWVAVLRGLPKLREPERFAPWLFTIARRSLMNRLRAQYAQPPDEAPEEVPEPDPLDRIELLNGLKGLPLVEREVLVLFHVHDLSLQECAEVIRVPAGTVKSRLFRARRMLREHLVERGFHGER
ncbi:RNA polymerase sigma factor [Lentzea sp. NBRC 105346]|uniref:RNA polymerase sigma factor n=1 Tax=Lentzea sp. NBRC 105346 TaxID=3032205 RepID=UPI0024A54748|nr:sigma-70 family RNA polymerase sigma factor [Lentzea sp. NBRC 105346]GLZ28998.1 RNA polymerase sigma factor [Lentzea sp. NBRC 105346]